MKTVQLAPMTTLKQRATRFGLGLGLAATLALSAVMPALAAPGDPNVTGSVTVDGASSIVFNVPSTLNLLDGNADVLLDGHDHTAKGDLGIDVTDYMGTGAGWVLQISTTGFSAGTGKTIPTSGFKVVKTAVSKVNDGAGTAPAGNVAPVTLSSTPASFMTAAVGEGQGDYDLVSSFELAVPANTLKGAYTAAITVDTITGQLP